MDERQSKMHNNFTFSKHSVWSITLNASVLVLHSFRGICNLYQYEVCTSWDVSFYLFHPGGLNYCCVQQIFRIRSSFQKKERKSQYPLKMPIYLILQFNQSHLCVM